jgi:endonuclease/exonuclease/phosphatase family metal-dependent hydrolase
VTRHPRIVVRAVTWNLFHGRVAPVAGYVGALDSVGWELALLQEAPPRWREQLAAGLEAQSATALTSRNFGAPVRSFIADRWPGLIKSNEGGSNQLLVRAPWRIDETRVHTLTRWPERRRMLWAALTGPDGAALAVANLHGSVDSVRGAREQVLEAAARAVEWAGEVPLVFGGDLNLRVTRQPEVFAELERRHGLAPPTGPDAIDHLLVRGMDLLDPPRRGPLLDLSDHAYVTVALGI